MTARHPMSLRQHQPRSRPQAGNTRRGNGSVMVVACIAAAGIVTGAIYAVQWKSTEAAPTAGAAAARSAAHHTHRGAKGPVAEPIGTPREEIFEHPSPEDQLSTAQAHGIAQQGRSPLGTLPLVRHGNLPLPGSFAADPENRSNHAPSLGRHFGRACARYGTRGHTGAGS